MRYLIEGHCPPWKLANANMRIALCVPSLQTATVIIFSRKYNLGLFKVTGSSRQIRHSRLYLRLIAGETVTKSLSYGAKRYKRVTYPGGFCIDTNNNKLF